MKSIKNYALEVTPTQTITVPFNSEILGLGSSNNLGVLYLLIDEQGREQKRTFHIFAEGKEIPPRFNQTHYVGAFYHKAEVGAHMLHVFEER